MISDFLFSLPSWVVVALVAWPVLALVVGLWIGGICDDADARIERIEQRMVELNRQDVDDRARDGIHFDGGWSRR